VRSGQFGAQKGETAYQQSERRPSLRLRLAEGATEVFSAGSGDHRPIDIFSDGRSQMDGPTKEAQ
jgi:hypothetical protein